uniref:Uncharacterized protein n=1 Tax=Fundidesulfovibrio putealis TaxID=270496 RepID=A0A7C4AHK1_9BACT
MNSIETRYGTLGPVDHVSAAPDGTVLSCVPAAPLTIRTPLGTLVAQHTTDDLRRPKVEPLEFHPDGTLRTIALETQTVVPTPLGPMAAELLTFYPGGELRRVFPLNGKLSGYWSEKEEVTLTAPMRIPTPAGDVEALIVGVQFHPGGALRSLTLWPGHSVEIDTPVGRQRARVGMAFHPDGALRSFEPASMIEVQSPIGALAAFDPHALGIHGDENSLCFHPDGSLAGLSTPRDTVTVTLPDGQVRRFAPTMVPNLCDERVQDIQALRICFHPGTVALGDDSRDAFPLEGHGFALGRLLQNLFAPISYACDICG